ncbi:hypothetical protein HZH66_003718 [Vespula vulgaris]|uniref:Uncharacterized protein n=1 Tax=Vespula vulgaris TaxID=7454 RepID=A0A834KDR9_VESVU|nr:hypothetical protein HZH66_003718 [Vespula vulgaris]
MRISLSRPVRYYEVRAYGCSLKWKMVIGRFQLSNGDHGETEKSPAVRAERKYELVDSPWDSRELFPGFRKRLENIGPKSNTFARLPERKPYHVEIKFKQNLMRVITIWEPLL